MGDNEEMRKIEEEMGDLKEEVSEKRDRLHEMDTDLAENQGGGKEDQQKKMMDFYEKMQLELGEFAAVKQQEVERNQLTVDKMEQELHKVRDESEKLQGIDE